MVGLVYSNRDIVNSGISYYMEKTSSGKFGIRVWGWPTLILWFLMLVWFLPFLLTTPANAKYVLEPESVREVLFESVLGILFIIYMWILVSRYKKLTGAVSWLTKWGVISLTVLMTVGEIALVLRYIYRY